MGWGSWLAGAGTIIGGFVAAPFTAGASIPAGLSAGASIIGRGIAADASKNAAKTQVAATDKALALQQPYMNAGTNAVNRLDSLMGGPLSSLSSPQPQLANSMQRPPYILPPGVPQQGGGAFASLLRSPQGQAMLQTSQSSGGGGGTASALIRAGGTASPGAPLSVQQGHSSGRMISMRAPDGSVKAVPASEAAHWQQMGAQVIG